LVMDRDTGLRSSLQEQLRRDGYRVFLSDQPDDIRRLIYRKRIEVALLNLANLKRAGLGLLSIVRDIKPWVSVILINRPDQIALSIEGMDLGAFDDFLLPFTMNDLMARVKDAVRQTRKLQPRRQNLRGKLDNLMIAVSFAEAGELETARHYLKDADSHPAEGSGAGLPPKRRA